MFDVVIPNKNEEDFIDVALSLGYGEIVFLSNDLKYKYSSKRINVKTAFLLSTTNQIGHAKKSFDYVFASADRKFFELRVHYIINAENSDRKDSFHYKRTALNQVHAKLSKDNNISIVFSFSNLFDKNRIITLGRMFQNAKLVNKYSVKSDSFSLATSPINMKSRTILDALNRVLGM
ncbi:MAG: hypothetical protein ACP5NV_01955 [Candidatus Woesearchaeota archaeon]